MFYVCNTQERKRPLKALTFSSESISVPSRQYRPETVHKTIHICHTTLTHTHIKKRTIEKASTSDEKSERLQNICGNTLSFKPPPNGPRATLERDTSTFLNSAHTPTHPQYEMLLFISGIVVFLRTLDRGPLSLFQRRDIILSVYGV